MADSLRLRADKVHAIRRVPGQAVTLRRHHKRRHHKRRDLGRNPGRAWRNVVIVAE
jgi:hypothetical protein